MLQFHDVEDCVLSMLLYISPNSSLSMLIKSVYCSPGNNTSNTEYRRDQCTG